MSSDSVNFSVENLSSWDDAIRKARGKIERLKRAIRVFEENKRRGEPWPEPQVEHVYKTGDPYPNPACNLLRFVEYDENGREVWTSIYRDNEAPYRLANLSEQRRCENMSASPRNPRTETPRRQDRNPSHSEMGAGWDTNHTG